MLRTVEPSRRRTVVGLAATILGAALFIWQIRKVGLDTLRADLAQVGAGFLVILILSLVRFVLRSIAWRTVMDEPVSLVQATMAWMIGDAAGNVTPFSLLASEPIKAMYVGGRVPVPRALAGLVAENLFYIVSVAAFIIAGAAAMLLRFDLPGVVTAIGQVSLVAMVLVIGVVLWVAWARPTVASAALARFPRLGLGRFIGLVREFEASAYGFLRQRPGRLAVVVFCETSFHLLSFVEAIYTVWLITGRWLPLDAFILDTFNRVVNVAFRMIPFKVGVDESGSGFLAGVIGLGSGVGVSLAIVRKGRMLVWAGVGFAAMAERIRRPPPPR